MAVLLRPHDEDESEHPMIGTPMFTVSYYKSCILEQITVHLIYLYYENLPAILR